MKRSTVLPATKESDDRRRPSWRRKTKKKILTVIPQQILLLLLAMILSTVKSFGISSYRRVSSYRPCPFRISGSTRVLPSTHPSRRRSASKHSITYLHSVEDGSSIPDYSNTSAASMPPMANLYREWTLEQDQLLWKYYQDDRKRSPVELASLLGRGMRGVEARLAKLQDVSSPAYERLFSSSNANEDNDNNSQQQQQQPSSTKTKLVPVGEVLRRIEWDYMLSAKDFSILHYDRVDDTTVESPLEAPNTSIQGKESLLIKALPEHRILSVKYKDRIVWDKATRLDLVFGDNPGIYQVMETYDEWKAEQDRIQESERQRQIAVGDRMERILGVASYLQLQDLSKDLLEAHHDPTQSTKAKVEEYVSKALDLFRIVRKDPLQSLEVSSIPAGDYDALNELSELVAVLPNVELRTLLLTELEVAMTRVNGGTTTSNTDVTAAVPKKTIELLEEDLTESFVRGSGPGGQKINKTNNKVVLVHEPTQLRVECQETRSLTQNRKIARKRLQTKLDEYWNGSQSKSSQKILKTVSKKQKQKVRNKTRLKKKQLEKQQEEQDKQETPSFGLEDDDFY